MLGRCCTMKSYIETSKATETAYVYQTRYMQCDKNKVKKCTLDWRQYGVVTVSRLQLYCYVNRDQFDCNYKGVL